ncbi:S-adenosyl-L-methionine-dependent methyltransferase [Trichodelitschia bisporula]|uniref:S-adenosyl-L-methionine-dependent methyltransferase n=1 Tax=Trichodelitschia bisporula TaxID=703511 RepID=A0A6G1HYD2_9PEZI|nr:S-adenosyl-L-methionine-dependent methyltransferase [Trichodelitschia bisporula]
MASNEPEGTPLEIDSNDTDSAYSASTRPSSLTSLASEIHRGIFENGRRYHAYGSAQYAFPNDEPELERLDMQHAMMTLLLDNKLYWAPIGHPQKVLDLGTGTGIWAIDFADLHPEADVTGTDLSPIQPHWVPQNCHFEIDDAEMEWTFGANKFDYIHNRNFVCAIRNWPRLIEQTFHALKPGGWVEWHEKQPKFMSDDDTLLPDSPLDLWSQYFFEAAEKFNTPADSPSKIKGWMEATGFVDIQQYRLKLPVGMWPKDQRLKKCGLIEMINMTEGIEGLSLMCFTRALGWSVEKVQLFLMEVRKHAKERGVHSYYHFYVIYGRKPEVGSAE